ncbi:MAG: GumC family protein [Beijerinckiaceae bacterium]
MIRTAEAEADQEAYVDDLDMRTLWAAVRLKKAWILVPTLAALLAAGAFITFVKPRYTAEAQVLLENQESFFTRPERSEAAHEFTSGPDPENVASQVQLVTSRDLGRRVIVALNLFGDAEFDPLVHGLGPISRVLVLFGVMRDPTRIPPEDRVLDAYLDRLTVFSPPKTRVLTIQFRSTDPELAARAANVIATLYIEMQSEVKRDAAKAAATSLTAEISDLRVKLARAEAESEQFRAGAGLLAGSNNMSITGQQFVELNSDLSKARTAQADAQAKASLIRDMLRQGRIGDVPDVANNDLVRRIAEQRVTAKSQLALESRTLLPGHPRIKELTAQIAGLDAELRAAAEKTVRALENEARIASSRVANMEAAIEQQKQSVTLANADDVHLRELERIAQGYRDQLQSSMTKYQEAVARENSPATPADARIFARASVPQEPTFPKKLPTLLFAGIAGFILSLGGVVSGQLLSGRNGKSDAISARPRQTMPRQILEPRETFGRSAADPRAAASDHDDFGLKHSKVMNVIDSKNLARLQEEDVPDKPIAELDESLASHRQWARLPRDEGKGVRIVATSLADDSAATARLVSFARELAREGRPIIVDLDAHSTRLSALLGARPQASLGLTDLLNGQASFAEVIHRDHASRLHFVSFGMAPICEPAELDLVLDALSQTYEFLIIVAPAMETDGLAMELAAHADLVALAASVEPDMAALEAASQDLYAAGAAEVILLDGRLEDEAAPAWEVA